MPLILTNNDRIGAEVLTPFGREQVDCTHAPFVSLLTIHRSFMISASVSGMSIETQPLLMILTCRPPSRVKYGTLLKKFTDIPVFRTTSEDVRRVFS